MSVSILECLTDGVNKDAYRITGSDTYKHRWRRSTVFQYVACISNTFGGGTDRELAGSNARESGSSAYHWFNCVSSSARAARFVECDGG